jgi:hypothetical protein
MAGFQAPLLVGFKRPLTHNSMKFYGSSFSLDQKHATSPLFCALQAAH